MKNLGKILIGTSIYIAFCGCGKGDEDKNIGRLTEEITQEENAYEKALDIARHPGKYATGRVVEEKQEEPKTEPEKFAVVGDKNLEAYYQKVDGNLEVYVKKDGKEIRITHNPGIDFRPSISPDKTKIAFYSERENHWVICTANVDGSNLTELYPIREQFLSYLLEWLDNKTLLYPQMRSKWVSQGKGYVPIQETSVVSYKLDITTKKFTGELTEEEEAKRK